MFFIGMAVAASYEENDVIHKPSIPSMYQKVVVKVKSVRNTERAYKVKVENITIFTLVTQSCIPAGCWLVSHQIQNTDKNKENKNKCVIVVELIFFGRNIDK